jgi:hypothetical protein
VGRDLKALLLVADAPCMDQLLPSSSAGSSALGRVAGQYARATARRYIWRTLTAFLVLAAAFPIAGLLVGFHNMALVPIELAMIALTFVVDRVASPIVERWQRGASGEERVGEIIDGLHTQGWLALHDAWTGRGNVDHILVGPAGLFTIETKSHAGRIDPDRIDARMLKQAYAQSKAVEKLTGLHVEPLLVFSRAYLAQRAVTHRRGVTILPARMLPRFLDALAQGIPAARIAAVHKSLADGLDDIT